MTLLATPESPPQAKRWTKREFNALSAREAFEGFPIFLFRGELVDMPMMGPRHAAGIKRITVWLVRSFDPEFAVRIQLPFETPGETVPQPNGAVVSPADDARLPHPHRAALLIEVSDSSVELDRQKAFDYAAAQVPDYWLQDMRSREVEVYRDPVPDPTSVTGWRYASHRVYREGESVAPLAKPEAAVAVSTLVRA